MSDLQPLLVASTPDHISNNPGAKYDAYTGTDYPYTPDPKTQVPASKNLRNDPVYAGFLDDVYDQGQMGSCVANASAAIYRFEFRRHIHDANLGNKPVISPSRLFIYYNSRLLEPYRPIGDTGTQNRDSLHGLEKYGVCEESTWPYIMLQYQSDLKLSKDDYAAYKNKESSQNPTDAAYDQALNHRTQGYYRLDIDRDGSKTFSSTEMDQDGEHVKANIKACISEGHPFIFGFHWETAKDNLLWARRPQDNAWTLSSLSNFKAKHVPVTGDAQGSFYGHAVVGYGYDEDGILCQNSWGVNKPNYVYNDTNDCKTYFRVPWEWVTDFTATNDFWMIKVVGN